MLPYILGYKLKRSFYAISIFYIFSPIFLPPPQSILSNRFLIFFILYIFLFALNAIFPTQSDDLGATFRGIEGALSSYSNWNGRFGELLRVAFGSYLAHTPIFAFINAFFGALIFYLVFMLFFGRIPLFNLTDCAIIAFMLLSFMIFRAFGAIFFWAAGSLNYLWAWSLILLWILPYRIFWQNKDNAKVDNSLVKALGMLTLGIIAGWCSEFGIVIVVLQIALLIYGIYTKRSLPLWYYAGIFGFIIGWVVLYSSPGHKNRAIKHFQQSGAYISLSDFLALSFKEKFLRYQKVFGSYKLYIIQGLVVFSLMAFYVKTYISTSRFYKVLLICIGLVVIACLSRIGRLCFLFPLLFIPFVCYLSFLFAKAKAYEKSTYVFIIAVLLFAYFLSIGATIQIGIPSRAKLHYWILDSGLFLFMCLIIKDAFGKTFIQYTKKAIIGMCIVYAIFVFSACAQMRLKWEGMPSLIDAQKAFGAKEIIVKKDTFHSYYRRYSDWGNPGDNPNVWPNTTYARFFGVEKFIAK